MTRIIPAWIPNWKDEQEYPDPENTTTRKWAWEFLRRNLSYQSEINELRTSRFFGQHREDSDEWSKYFVAWCSLATKYGLDGCLPLPEENNPSRIRFVTEQPALVRMRCANRDDPRFVEFVFDLSKPIESQLKKVGWQLRSFQKSLQDESGLIVERKHKHPSSYKNYLRILDAKVSGATNADIEHIVYPEDEKDVQSKVKYELRQARRLCKDGYLTLF